MLTLILLVVLGGGVGLLAVSLAESPKPATDGDPPRRAPETDDGDTPPRPKPKPKPKPAPANPAPSVPAPLGPMLAGPAMPGRSSLPVSAPAPSAQTAATAVVEEPEASAVDSGPPRRASRGDIPKAYTAVEGRYRDVGRAPVWRRLVSLVLIALIAVGVGAAIAAILGAAIGAAAEILGNTIG